MRQLRNHGRTISSGATINSPGPLIVVAHAGPGAVAQRRWRVNPQIGQDAISLSGSTIRKLVQPFVLQ